ncbi:MAG: hypothetical protein JNL11_03985 [Bdellovibrionaceae bacterium]|nr:hypothetical protein [Pseudobdellovibrionaceae bacterium]
MCAAFDEVSVNESTITWENYSKETEQQEKTDRRNGISYIISGSLALAGGILGGGLTDDNLEKGIYTIFQTIGVASVGYGAYIWKIGGEERMINKTLNTSRLTPEQRTQFLRSYYTQKKASEKRERQIKAITHGLIAGLNFYNASQQKQDSIKSGLYFIGGVNLLASISFTFEF